MKIYLHKNFKKKYKKLGRNERKKFKERRNLFLQDPYHPLLHNHPLKGKYSGYRSINIGGDLRVVYKFLKDDAVIFTEIGTHSELYK